MKSTNSDQNKEQLHKKSTHTKRYVLIGITLSVVMALVGYQHVNAALYESTDDDRITKVRAEQYKGKKDLWIYLVKFCANNHSAHIAEIMLKSDTETQYLGVHNLVPKGTCTYFGTVMSAKNGNSLGAKVLETQEAWTKLNKMKSDIPTMPRSEWTNAVKEIMRLQYHFI